MPAADETKAFCKVFVKRRKNETCGPRGVSKLSPLLAFPPTDVPCLISRALRHVLWWAAGVRKFLPRLALVLLHSFYKCENYSKSKIEVKMKEN